MLGPHPSGSCSGSSIIGGCSESGGGLNIVVKGGCPDVMRVGVDCVSENDSVERDAKRVVGKLLLLLGTISFAAVVFSFSPPSTVTVLV